MSVLQGLVAGLAATLVVLVTMQALAAPPWSLPPAGTVVLFTVWTWHAVLSKEALP